MMNLNISMICKETGRLQIPYADYVALMEKVMQARKARAASAAVIEELGGFLESDNPFEEVLRKIEAIQNGEKPPEKELPPEPVSSFSLPKTTETADVEAVSVEFDAEEILSQAVSTEEVDSSAATRKVADGVEIPPIKKDISSHFNEQDESGRLFSVFKQYYTCLNDACGGTVRVTMKDGFCSLWNYDEWEEFAYIDIFEGQLRVALDPRHTDALTSLDMCEVPRLLSSRRDLVCVQVDDLNNTMLKVLVKAFQEVGLATG